MKALRILLLEDSLLDAELIQAHLIECGINCELVRVETRADFSASLEKNSFDLILADYSLPTFDGISALEIARAKCPDVPFIFVSATLGEELAIEMLKMGATDYVLKQRLWRLAPSVQRSLREAKERADRQRAEAALRQKAEELEQANRVKDEFLAVLSHELRSPLNSILGWANLLRTRKFDEATMARALETIERNARLQTQLIGDLLDISRIIRGKVSLNPCPISLTSSIEAAITTMGPAAEAKGIQIRFEVENGHGDTGVEEDTETRSTGESPTRPNGDTGNFQNSSPHPPIQVWGDADRLQQIVWNLLSNAIKFTPQGGRVEVRLERVEQGDTATRRHGDTGTSSLSTSPRHPFPASISTPYAQIQVSDTGKGISPEFLPHVFEYFRQADSSTTRAEGGLGLGLAIVRYLVELHGGTISAESPGEEQGTTFTVKLPLMNRPSEMAGGSQPLTNSPGLLDGVRVLVVDDEPDTCNFLTFTLEQYGGEATAVTSVGEVLEALEQFRPDVLVSDIGMPEEDGYTLIHKVRTLEPESGGHIPAMALTAYAREEDCERALSAGFQAHISKPVEPDKLVTAIAELAGRVEGTAKLIK